jgi:hypothetical protein
LLPSTDDPILTTSILRPANSAVDQIVQRYGEIFDDINANAEPTD